LRYEEKGSGLTILDVGGRKGERDGWFPEDSEMTILNLPKCGEGDKFIDADIADSNLDISEEYDIGNRRGNVNTQYGFWKSARDMPPRDELGGFLENWETLFACRRISFRYD
jgi:hypothetical protein